ncbi:MAG: LapA dom protein, partial [Candidatus Rokubacteria bacterium]|nr:LapA dom protein [Candidatus Rokubacteria bacterium]
MTLAYILMALVGAACAVFALQNMDPVVIRFIGWRAEGIPLALVIL